MIISNRLKSLSSRVRGILFHLRHFRIIKCRTGSLRLFPKCAFSVDRSSSVDIDGRLTVGTNYVSRSSRSSIIRLDAKARLLVRGSFSLFYDSDVVIFEGGTLRLGNDSFINSNCKIRCHKAITIGDGCAISHDVTIMDSDAHYLNGSKNTRPIVIGNHVWIGTRVTILSGITIGDGAVIAAGALVLSDVLPGSLVGGVPAKVLKNKVDWSK